MSNSIVDFGNDEDFGLIHGFIERDFPGVIQYTNGKIYLCDRTISNEPLKHTNTTWICIVNKPLSVLLNGKDFTLLLFINKLVNGSVLTMDYDFGLSDQTSMNLFEKDISITYIDPDGYASPTHYNRDAVIRRVTIENIIR